MMLATVVEKTTVRCPGLISEIRTTSDLHEDSLKPRKNIDATAAKISPSKSLVTNSHAKSTRKDSTISSSSGSIRKCSTVSTTTTLSKDCRSGIASNKKSSKFKTIEDVLRLYIQKGTIPEVTEVYRLPELRQCHWIFRYTTSYTKYLAAKDQKLLKRICDYMLLTGETPPYNPDYIFYTKTHRMLVFHPFSLTRPEFRKENDWKCSPNLIKPEAEIPRLQVPDGDQMRMQQIIDSIGGSEFLEAKKLTYRRLFRLILDRNHYPKTLEVLKLLAPFRSHKFTRSLWRLFIFGWHPVDREILHYLAVIYRNLEDESLSDEVDENFVALLSALGPLAEMTFRDDIPPG